MILFLELNILALKYEKLSSYDKKEKKGRKIHLHPTSIIGNSVNPDLSVPKHPLKM